MGVFLLLPQQKNEIMNRNYLNYYGLKYIFHKRENI